MPGVAKQLRITVLLYILLLVAGGTWLSIARTTDWDKTLWVAIYPIDGDLSRRSEQHIAALTSRTFKPISDFMEAQARRYKLPLQKPFHIVLGQRVTEQPPDPPHGGNVLRVMWWSLKMRFWAWRVDKGEDPPLSDIELYVRYFDPETHPTVAHSFGLQKGLIGVINVFASRVHTASNNVVIAHELLHTLGATDKYNLQTNYPLFPIGFADAQALPLFPQKQAELMGGRIPVSEIKAVIPRSLNQAVIGPVTALEIGWIE